MDKQKIRVEAHISLGMLWFGGWLFTLGYLDLSFWRGVLAILVWPFFLGADMALMPDVPMPPQSGG